VSASRLGLAALAAGAALATPASSADTATLAGSWRGTFTLPRVLPVSVELRGSTATVILSSGHAARTVVPARTSGGRLRFALPGRPTPLRFAGRLRPGAIVGTVTQAGLRGSFRLRRGGALASGDLGAYRLDSGHALGVVEAGGRRLLIDFDADEIHGLFRRGGGVWDVGSGLGVRAPVAASVRFGPGGADIGGAHASGVPVRQLEVRFRSGSAWLAGTLTLPAAPGRHPGVVLVHGSGPTPRDDEGVLAAFFAGRGLAVLAYDKRGIDQSGGSWPGEAATPGNVEQYARDAEAAIRFLAAQPELDAARVGLAGSSQAGWIAPLAASRNPAVRFLVLVSGPTVTEGESDGYGELTTRGQSPPTLPPDEILDQVRNAGSSGFDPLPAIRRLTIPGLWLYGALDQHVPTVLCVERLAPIASEAGRDLRYVVFPHADHFLIESEHGLNEEDLRSHRYAAGYFGTVDAWLAQHTLKP
jgi:dienelactone hydrolase